MSERMSAIDVHAPYERATNCRVRLPDTGRNRMKVDPRLRLARLARRPIAESSAEARPMFSTETR
jgi:hypothetical protein